MLIKIVLKPVIQGLEGLEKHEHAEYKNKLIWIINDHFFRIITAYCYCHSFSCRHRVLELLAGDNFYLLLIPVTAVFFVMIKDEPGNSRRPADSGSLLPSRVPPFFLALVVLPVAKIFIIGEMGIIDENIRTANEIQKSVFLSFIFKRFCLCCVNYCRIATFHPVGQTAIGVIHREGLDGDVFCDADFPAGSKIYKFIVTFHHFHSYGKMRGTHLLLDNLLKSHALGAFILPVKAEFISWGIKGCEKGQTLNVIPVKMGKEDVCLDALPPGQGSELVPQLYDAGTGIEYQCATSCLNFHAGGVTPEQYSVTSGGGLRAPHTPKFNF